MPGAFGQPDAKVMNAATFIIKKDDHTVGDLLTKCVAAGHRAAACFLLPRPKADPNLQPRRQLLQDPRVLFAGYRVPHPLEAVLEVRVQVTPDTTPIEVLRAAVQDCTLMVQQIGDKFKVRPRGRGAPAYR